MKICTKCEEPQDLNFYTKKAASKDGLSPVCKGCVSIASKVYQKQNKDKIAVNRAKNRERDLKVGRLYYHATKHLQDKEAARAYNRSYYIKNRDYIKCTVKLWQANNRGRCNAIFAKYTHSKLQRTPPWLTEEDFSIMRAYYRVAQKLTEVTGEIYHVDHIVPLQGALVSGLHCPSNLQVLKGTDNCSKGNSFTPH